MLRRVSDLVAHSTRGCDAACRYGGEETALLLTDTDIVAAHAVAERIRGQLTELKLAPKRKMVAVTASFGVVEVLEVAGAGGAPKGGDLFAAADAALYAAKREGVSPARRHVLPSIMT